MEAAQSRVQDAFAKMIDTVDREQLRKVEADMYHCSARCCENPEYKMEDVQRCTSNCSAPYTQFQAYIQNEIKGFQDRLQRCAMDCSDKARDQMSSSPTEAEMVRLRGRAESCAVDCADTHIALLGSMQKRIIERIRANKT